MSEPRARRLADQRAYHLLRRVHEQNRRVARSGLDQRVGAVVEEDLDELPAALDARVVERSEPGRVLDVHLARGGEQLLVRGCSKGE